MRFERRSIAEILSVDTGQTISRRRKRHPSHARLPERKRVPTGRVSEAIKRPSRQIVRPDIDLLIDERDRYVESVWRNSRQTIRAWLVDEGPGVAAAIHGDQRRLGWMRSAGDKDERSCIGEREISVARPGAGRYPFE